MKKLDIKIIVYILVVIIVAIAAIVVICTSSKETENETANEALTASTEAQTVTTTEATTTTTTEATTETTTKKKTTTTTKKTTTAQNSTSTSSKGYKIEVIDGITYVDGVLIANKTYSLPSTYNPGGLTKECKAAFDEMAAAAKEEEGLTLTVCSGYRSYSYQKKLYNNYVDRDGQTAADRYSARPGHSEHQTGLAIDVNRASSKFTGTPEQIWLAANCYKYGFIIRYPEGKESITGYKYESWHVRYLGKDLAKKVYDSGLCLEEYYGITSEYA